MSFASLPPTGLQTSVTVIDPPKPLPAFLTGSDGHQPPSAPHLAQSATPSRVPYPSAAHASLPLPTAPSQNAPVKTPLTGQVSNATAKAAKTKRTFKVIIVGDAGVGKTCLSFRFCCGRFPAHTEATIGVDFRERSVMIEKELLRIQLWDTAGQERYRQSIVAHYYRNVNAVVFVYDVSSPKSFASLGSWIAECEKHGLTGSAEVPRILVGNKCDLQGAGERVNTDTAQMFADRHNMALFETSAKAESEADHVESIFMTLVHKLQQSKPMHVQSEGERKCKEQETLLLKAGDANQLEEDGWCC